jgi:putative PIN family toxin of toxin-antitoxin system
MYPGSVPGRIVAAWREARFDLVLSVEQLTEIGRVLAYKKIRRVLQWDDHTIGRFVKQLMLRAEVVELAGVSSVLPRDPADTPILRTLIAATADFLVTGDEDLPALRREYPILPPVEFSKKLD